MAETSYFWDGTAIGDATLAPYDAATEFADVIRLLTGMSNSVSKSGIVNRELNELTASISGANILIDTGAAIVYGSVYKNSAIVTIPIPTPVTATRWDRIVLRKDWTLQTVRLVRTIGPEGGVPLPLVQTPGVIWEMPLINVLCTTGGVITFNVESWWLEDAIAPPNILIYRNLALSVPDGGYNIEWDSVWQGYAGLSTRDSPAMWTSANPTRMIFNRGGLYEIYGSVGLDMQANVGSLIVYILHTRPGVFTQTLRSSASFYKSSASVFAGSNIIPFYFQLGMSPNDYMECRIAMLVGTSIPLMVGGPVYSKFGTRYLQQSPVGGL